MARLGTGLWGRGDESERRLRSAFSWLTRNGIGHYFGRGLPISWYQSHQVCALDEIDRRAGQAVGVAMATNLDGSQRVIEDYDAKVSDGMVYVRRNGQRRYKQIGSVRELFDAADRCTRGRGR